MKQELRYEELTLAKVKEMRNWDKKRGAPRNLENSHPFWVEVFTRMGDLPGKRKSLHGYQVQKETPD
jgi:hypothetical protein